MANQVTSGAMSSATQRRLNARRKNCRRLMARTTADVMVGVLVVLASFTGGAAGWLLWAGALALVLAGVWFVGEAA